MSDLRAEYRWESYFIVDRGLTLNYIDDSGEWEGADDDGDVKKETEEVIFY